MSRTHPLIVESGAEILKALRAPEYIIPTLIMPVAFYSLFGIVLSMGGGNNAEYLLATYGVFAVMGPAVFGFGIAVATERERGWLELKRAAPIAGSTYLLAKVFATVVFASLALAPLYIAAGFFGGVALPRSTWAQLLGVHVLATLPFILIGLTVGLSMKANGAVAVANLLFLGLAVLGGLWIPIVVFPPMMQAIASFLPSYHLAEIALAVAGAPGERSLATHAGALVAMTAGLLGITLLAWRRQSA
jgi:ABC-2 type transport system permease protein